MKRQVKKKRDLAEEVGGWLIHIDSYLLSRSCILKKKFLACIYYFTLKYDKESRNFS